MPVNADYGFAYLVFRESEGDYFIAPQTPEKDVTFSNDDSLIENGQFFEIHDASALDGGYDYAGKVKIPGDGDGYIVYNVSAGQFYLLTNTEINFDSKTLNLSFPDT